jgi:hypothetical protein
MRLGVLTKEYSCVLVDGAFDLPSMTEVEALLLLGSIRGLYMVVWMIVTGGPEDVGSSPGHPH